MRRPIARSIRSLSSVFSVVQGFLFFRNDSSLRANDRDNLGFLDWTAFGEFGQQARQTATQRVLIEVAHSVGGLAQLSGQHIPGHAARLREEDLRMARALVAFLRVEEFLNSFSPGRSPVKTILMSRPVLCWPAGSSARQGS